MANDGNKKKYIKYEDTTYILQDSRFPEPAAADNGKVLGVVNGAYALKDDEGVFIAERGTTTNAEIYAAFQAGKAVICVYGDNLYYLYDCKENSAHFASPVQTNGYVLHLSVTSNVWFAGTPTRFATASELDDKQDKLTAGTNITIDENNVISASGGGSDTALKQTLSTLLVPILRQGLYGADQETAIAALETALGGEAPVQTYTIRNVLTNVTTSNDATATVQGAAYAATLTPASGMELQTVTVTMGGVDVTASVYSNGAISISSVTGDIIITATAEAVIETYTPAMSEGYINVNTGATGGTSTYHHTEIIPVRQGDKVYGSCYDTTSAASFNNIQPRFTATYDSGGTIYPEGGNANQAKYTASSPFAVPAGVFGVVFSLTTRYTDLVIYVDKSERVGA